MTKAKSEQVQQVEQVAPQVSEDQGAQVTQPATDSREAIALQIAALKKQQAEQREAMKAQREQALAALAKQREEMKQKREAAKAELDAKKAAAKADRDAERAKKAAEKLAAAQEKAAERTQREAARLEREKARLAAMQERVMNPQVEQNGIRRPKDGTKCGMAWKLFDDASVAKGAPCAISEVLTKALQDGLVEGNVRAEYSRWRRFHGIIGRISQAPAVNETPEQAEPQAA